MYIYSIDQNKTEKNNLKIYFKMLKNLSTTHGVWIQRIWVFPENGKLGKRGSAQN